MTSISVSRNDEGRLQAHSKRSLQPVARPQPCRLAGDQGQEPVRHSTPALQPAAYRQRGAERRRNERRQWQIPIILDTRSRHERRSHPRRSSDTASGTGWEAGWDAYA